MSNIKSDSIKDKEYRENLFSAVPIYYENKDTDEPESQKLKKYAANVIADGFVKYSGDKKGEIALDIIRPKVLEDDYLVEKIRKKAKEAKVKVSLGEYTKKYNESNKDNNKEVAITT